MTRRRPVLAVLGLLAAAYVAVACIRYAFAHPELTDTQRFLHLWDALAWR